MKKRFRVEVPKVNKDGSLNLSKKVFIGYMRLEQCPVCGGHVKATRVPAFGECVGHQGVILVK